MTFNLLTFMKRAVSVTYGRMSSFTQHHRNKRSKNENRMRRICDNSHFIVNKKAQLTQRERATAVHV